MASPDPQRPSDQLRQGVGRTDAVRPCCGIGQLAGSGARERGFRRGELIRSRGEMFVGRNKRREAKRIAPRGGAVRGVHHRAGRRPDPLAYCALVIARSIILCPFRKESSAANGHPRQSGCRSDRCALSRLWLLRSVIVVSVFIGPGWLPERLVRLQGRGDEDDAD
jgi:hypothetical protein